MYSFQLSAVDLLSIPPVTPNTMSCIPQSYTGRACQLELQNQQNCMSIFDGQNDSDVLIPSDIDQELREKKAQLLFIELELLTQSEECQKDLKSFWCPLLFGMCDMRGQRVSLPSYKQCIQLHNGTCSDVAKKKDTPSLLLPECVHFNQNFSYGNLFNYILLLSS